MKKIITALALNASLLAGFAQATVISFTSQLDVIDIDEGGAIYSGVPIGTPFSGNIDDVTANGSITGGGITVNFTCCEDAGGLSFTNDSVIDSEVAGNLNLLSGTSDFMAGQTYDFADLEGDTGTPSGGRIEVGLSFVFPSGTYANEDPGNSLDLDAALLTAFFILEENASRDTDIYAGIGLVGMTTVPIPGAVWLLGSGLGVVAFCRRKIAQKPCIARRV